MDGEAEGEEDALLRSGPLSPAFDEEVLISDVRVSSVSGAVAHGDCKPIPACRSRTEPGQLNRGRNKRKFGGNSMWMAVQAGYLASMLALALSCTMNWA